MIEKDKKINMIKPIENKEFEECILSSCLHGYDLDLIFALVQKKDFYYEKHAIIFEACLKLYDKKEPVNFVTAINAIRDTGCLEKIGGASFVTNLIDFPVSADIAHYAQDLKKKRAQREIVETAQKIISISNADKIPDDFLDTAQKMMMNIQIEPLNRYKPMPELIREAINRYEQKDVTDTINTGFRGIDYLLNGIKKSSLISIGARTSIGKTALGLNIAKNLLKQGNPPLPL